MKTGFIESVTVGLDNYKDTDDVVIILNSFYGKAACLSYVQQGAHSSDSEGGDWIYKRRYDFCISVYILYMLCCAQSQNPNQHPFLF